jgi:hypothetical protein
MPRPSPSGCVEANGSHGQYGTSSASQKAMQNAFTADIEDYFHTEAMFGVASG